MNNCICNSAEGIGVAPSLPANPLYFTQVAIPEIVVIPPQKPNCEELLSVMVEAKVISVRLIKTAVGLSNEGQNLTGYKIIIELELNQKIKYIADEPTQSVHAAHFKNVISSIFVVVPPSIGGINIEDLFEQGRLVVTPYIEDIYGVCQDKRTIFKNITVLIDVTTL